MSLRSAIILWCAWSCCLATTVQAQPPAISFAQPAGIPPGTATDVTFFGTNLSGPTAFWSDLEAAAELAPGIENNGSLGDRVTYRIAPPADAAVGIVGYRVATGQGISHLRLLMVDDLPTAVDNGANQSPETAQAIPFPTAIDGACETESFDYYRFAGFAGQRLAVEVVAQRLGSRLDPVVRLLDSARHELAYSDDEPSIGADCRFVCRLPADGEYLLEIRDIRYQGSDAHRYRMRIGDFPLVTVPFPLAAASGTTAQILVCQATGSRLMPADLRLEVAVPAELASPLLRLGVRYPAGQGSAFTTLAVGRDDEAIEFEPNDTPETASPARLSGAWNGRFEKAGDRDYYQFDAPAGARFQFVGQTRSLGSPSDLYLRLYRADGTLLGEADDSGTAEGVLDYTFAEAGVYRLMVEDLHRRGGPEHAYRVGIESYHPGFTLTLDSDRFDAPQGGVFVANVSCQRSGYDGPITLSLEGCGETFALSGQMIPENKSETVLNVTLPSSLPTGAWRHLRVVGRADIGGREFVAQASTLAALRGQFFGLPFPPQDLDGLVGLGVGPVFPDFFKLAIEGSSIVFPQLVGRAAFDVRAERLAGYQGPIALRVDGLPPGFSAEVKSIEKDQNEATIVVTGPPAAAPATHRLRVVGSATHQNQPKQVVLGDLPLRVTQPLEIAVAPAGPLAAGGTQKVKFTARLFNEEKPAMTITWVELPPGVTGPESITIPAGQIEVETELKAAGDAMTGQTLNIAALAKTTILGREIVVPATGTIEVRSP